MSTKPSARDPAAMPQRFYSLDVLRGLAALAVVFWHWQHFFYQGTTLDKGFRAEEQPLFFMLRPLYTDGWRGVDLFFCLSGFIFFWLYARKIGARTVSAREFGLLRFSRLYPLHLATLLVVAVAQIFILRRTGSYLIYPNNDLRHFALQLALASNWGFERNLTFNGPVWSVSIEALLYVVFFTVCRFRLQRWWHLAMLMGIGCGLMVAGRSDLGRGFFAFFLGGITFQVFAWMVSRKLSHALVIATAAVTILTWIAIPFVERLQLAPEQTGHPFHVGDVAMIFLAALPAHAWQCVLFPLTILTLALWETRRGHLGRRFSILGDISYSSYLLHFPLQLLFLGMAYLLAAPKTDFNSPWVLIAFFAVLIPLSFCSYRFFERPLQGQIRNWMKGMRSKTTETNHELAGDVLPVVAVAVEAGAALKLPTTSTTQQGV